MSSGDTTDRIGEIYERLLAARAHENELLDIAADMQRRWLDARERRKAVEKDYAVRLERNLLG